MRIERVAGGSRVGAIGLWRGGGWGQNRTAAARAAGRGSATTRQLLECTRLKRGDGGRGAIIDSKGRAECNAEAAEGGDCTYAVWPRVEELMRNTFECVRLVHILWIGYSVKGEFFFCVCVCLKYENVFLRANTRVLEMVTRKRRSLRVDFFHR